LFIQILLNDTLIANSWSDLTDGSIIDYIDKNVEGDELSVVLTYTGTNADGSSGVSNCNEWTSGGNGLIGNKAIDAGWMALLDIPCNNDCLHELVTYGVQLSVLQWKISRVS